MPRVWMLWCTPHGRARRCGWASAPPTPGTATTARCVGPGCLRKGLAQGAASAASLPTTIGPPAQPASRWWRRTPAHQPSRCPWDSTVCDLSGRWMGWWQWQRQPCTSAGASARLQQGAQAQPACSPPSPLPLAPTPAADGLPTGLSFLGRPFDEPTIIRLAYAFEQATQHRRPPPLLPECRGALADDAAASPTAG